VSLHLSERPLLLDLGNGGQTQIEEVDTELVAGYGWYRTPNGYVGAMVRVDGKRKLLLLHRLIMGEPQGAHVDHLNGDKLDNRRSNLRVASYQQNQANRRRPGKRNSSGHRGVSYCPHLSAAKPWRVQLMANRKQLHIGMFPTVEEAVAARKAAERLHFGEECP
jgi:hypothetical protein